MFTFGGDGTMRRSLLTLTAAAAFAVLAVPAQAQLSFGVHGAAITGVDRIVMATETRDLNSTLGAGGRVLVSPPVFPVSLFGSAQKYFPECPASNADCSLWTAEAGLQLGLPLPMVRPYLLGGIQSRNEDGESMTGYVAGAGIQLNFVVSLFLEGMVEFVDLPTGLPSGTDVSPFVLKGGIVF